MPKLFCLTGKSNTGKDTLARRLLSDPDLGLERLIMYTTRPLRTGETDGEEYHFISESELEARSRRFPVIERRVYRTIHGPWIYCTLEDEAWRRARKLLAVTPLPALEAFAARLGRDAVVPLYVETPDAERLRRAIARESWSRNPSYSEVCRRYLADEEDFSEEKLAAAGITRRFVNLDLDRCAAEMKAYTEKEQSI